VSRENRQTTFCPTLLPDEQKAIEFYSGLTAAERWIVATRSKLAIKFVALIRRRRYSEVACLLMKGCRGTEEIPVTTAAIRRSPPRRDEDLASFHLPQTERLAPCHEPAELPRS
jgi:hypothetical protein